jgi:hypothetical protein
VPRTGCRVGDECVRVVSQDVRDLAVGALVGILRLRRDFASLRHGSAQDDRIQDDMGQDLRDD